MTDKIEEIRKAREGATPGPYRQVYGDVYAQDAKFPVAMCANELDANFFALAPDMAQATVKHVEWLEHEHAVCKAAGDRAGAIAYGRALAAYRKAVDGKE